MLNRILIPYSALLTLLTLLLGSALYVGVDTRHSFKSLFEEFPGEVGRVVFWGDSLTAGEGASFRHDMPSLVGAALRRDVYNGGVGGQTSSQVRDRMLAHR